MLKLFVLAALLQAAPSQPEANFKFRDRAQAPTPVTDKDLRPMKPPDCKSEAEVQRALEQLSYGEPGDCFIRDRSRFATSTS